jgi:hypothetical protein
MSYLLNWADVHAGTSEWVSSIVSLLALAFAIRIGFIQNSINEKLVAIEDSVEIYGYPIFNNETIQRLRITNVGKIQIYLQDYQINGQKKCVQSHLIPVGQQQNAWYDILIPPTELAEDTIKIFVVLKDQMNRRWESKIEINKVGNFWETSVLRIKQI